MLSGAGHGKILGAIRAVARAAGEPGEIFCQVNSARLYRFPTHAKCNYTVIHFIVRCLEVLFILASLRVALIFR